MRDEEMNDWLEERIRRLELSIGRCRTGVGLFKKLGHQADPVAELHFFRKESSICLKRALALWWGLRWGRK